MAPKSKDKRKRKELAGKGKSKFVNEEASSRCEALRSVPFIFERGFVMDQRGWKYILITQMEAMGWERLCHPRCEVVVPWVYEFYANAKFSEVDKVVIRGRVVDYSAGAINEMFELPTMDVEHYRAIQSSVSPNEMVAAVCGSVPPAWTLKYKNGLQSTCLSQEAKVWLLFINAGILPTKHLNNISFDRLSIIYCILKRIKFDVGLVLNESLRTKIKEEKGRFLWFPTLITELCKNAGVHIGAETVVTQVGHHITETVIEVNIKVAKEAAEGSENARNRAAGRYIRPGPSKPEPCDVVVTDTEYIKTHLRLQHLYFDSRADYICDVLAQLMHKEKLKMPEPNYKFAGNFDSEGFLVDEEGEWIDATSGNDDETDGDDDANEGDKA